MGSATSFTLNLNLNGQTSDMDVHLQQLTETVEDLQSASDFGLLGTAEISELLRNPAASNNEQQQTVMDRLQRFIGHLNNAATHAQAIMNAVQVRAEGNIRGNFKNVHSLSDDLLAIIFEMANEDKCNSDFPCYVSQVDRRLRSVALHTPKLWSSLWPEYTWYKTRLYLDRSSNVGIVIHIRNGDRLEKFMQIVSKHKDRWEKVIFDFPEDERVVTVAGTVTPWDKYCRRIPRNLNLPNLHEIDFEGVPLMVNNEQLPFASWNMPSLKGFSGRTLIFPISARSLTHCSLLLKGSNVTIIDGSQLCVGLADLQTCTSLQITFGPFHMCTNFMSDDMDLTPTPLPNLQKFSAKIWHPTQYKTLQDIFNLVIYPERLISLELDYSSLEDLTQFLGTYCFEKLEHLSLWYSAGDVLESDTFLLQSNLMPSLKHIKLASEDAQLPLAFSTLNKLPPSLESISFYQCHAINKTYLSLLVGTLSNPLFSSNFKCLNLIECKIPDDLIKELRGALPEKLIWSRFIPRRGWS